MATIELPADLQAFAEERVRAGEYATVEDVVVAAVEKQRLEALRLSIDAGIAELDGGRGKVMSPREMVADASSDLDLDA